MEKINIGYIVGFHGLKGEIKVKSTTDFTKERFVVGQKLYLAFDNQWEELIIKTCRYHHGLVLISFEGFDSLTKVEKFKGCALQITQAMLYELEEDEFYHFDLIGLEVVSCAGQNLGKVKSIMSAGAQDVLVVDSSEKDILIPFVSAIVNQVDLKNKMITLFEIEGLW